MTLSLALSMYVPWTNQDDLSRAYVFARQINNPTNLKIETALDGGFSLCSFNLEEDIIEATFYYNSMLLARVRVMDEFGKLVWNGRITSVGSEPGQLTFEAEGYFAALNDSFVEFSYDDTTIITPPEFMKAVSSLQSHYKVYDGLLDPDGKMTNNIAPIGDWEPGSTLKDAAKEAMSRGDIEANPIYAVVYEYLEVRSRIMGQKPSRWYVSYWDMPIGQQAIALTRSIEKLSNAVTTMYSAYGSGDRRLTQEYIDQDSIDLYGRFQRMLSTGYAVEPLAEQIASLFLEEHRMPLQTSIIMLDYNVTDYSGFIHPLWHIRAGDSLIIKDIPYFTNNDEDMAFLERDGTVAIIVGSTSYSMDDNRLNITLDELGTMVDILIANTNLRGVGND